MCTMIRTFHPIGQGLFCTERFFCSGDKPINLVYDCGSLRGICKVRNSIVQTFAPKEEVEAVYISHFDSDHVNGLPFLLQRCKVKNLYLPFITSELELAFKRASFNKENKKIVDVLDRLLSMRNEGDFQISDTRKTRVVFIHPQDAEEGGANQQPRHSIAIGEDKWVCCPYNYDSATRRVIYDNAVSSILKKWKIAEADFKAKPQSIIQGLGEERARRFLKQMRDRLLADFSSAKVGDVNSNSMMLYSGPESGSVVNWNKISYCGKVNMKGGYKAASATLSSTHDKPGCLYFGDYKAKDAAWNAMNAYYSGQLLWNNIGCVQIPHHGSWRSFSTNFALMTDACFVASFGIRNRFGHPGQQELLSLRNVGIPVYEATEHSTFYGAVTHK